MGPKKRNKKHTYATPSQMLIGLEDALRMLPLKKNFTIHIQNTGGKLAWDANDARLYVQDLVGRTLIRLCPEKTLALAVPAIVPFINSVYEYGISSQEELNRFRHLMRRLSEILDGCVNIRAN